MAPLPPAPPPTPDGDLPPRGPGAEPAGEDTPPGYDLLHLPTEQPPLGAEQPPIDPEHQPTGLASPPVDRDDDGGAQAARDQTASRESWRSWANWGSLGIEFAAGIVVFFLLGSWADDKWGTDPWLRVAGAFVGIVLGTYLLIKKALASESSDRTDRPPRTPSGPQGRA